jgi:hypothetical protein
VLHEEGFQPLVKQIIQDFDDNVFPNGAAAEIPTQWKNYIKDLGQSVSCDI